jgi:aromatic ring-opening dioxygenase catalytic subunit (LigB family)
MAKRTGAEFSELDTHACSARAGLVHAIAMPMKKSPVSLPRRCMPRAYTGVIVKRLPVYFISHGGGPWSFMDEESRAPYTMLSRELADMPRQVGVTPAAILMISAHWEEAEFTLTANPRPPMIYDYYGFPDYTYQIRYDAPGEPKLAARVKTLIEAAGIPARLDTERGFDHGAFTPLNVMYPRADVPVVQLSLKQGLDPVTHLSLGRALSPLRDEGVLIVGSGLTYHNMRGFNRPESKPVSYDFEAYLNEAISAPDAARRNAMLVDWENAPSARLAHPREDHLLPLMVAAGAAGSDVGHRVFVDEVANVAMASYMFGGQP